MTPAEPTVARHIFDLFDMSENDDFNYIYRGVFSEKITDAILALGEVSLGKISTPAKVKKRVYLVMVEGLQNVTKHQSKKIEEIPDKDFFVIQHKSDNYYVTTANLIHNNALEVLKSQIDKVNELDKDGLKAVYKEILKFGELSSKGGAGLGLIDMAKRSGNKLKYFFRPYSDDYSFFYLQVAVLPEDGDLQKKSVLSLSQIIDLHKTLTGEKISLIFNSPLNQDNLLYLLSIIENQLNTNESSNSYRKKVYNTMVEMMQNIIHHGESIDRQSTSIPGIFYISEGDDNFTLFAGNYIFTKNLYQLQAQIDYVNSLTFDELEVFYNKRLFNFEMDTEKGAGLGIIDIRLKSRGQIHYSFKKMNDEFTFFSIYVPIQR